MSQTHDDVRALRVMVDELRAEPPPELPWDAIEKRLLARIALERGGAVRSLHGRPHVSASAFSRVLGFAVAAAVLAFGVSSMSRSDEPSSSAAPERHVVQALAATPGAAADDLSRLAPGDIVEAGDAPVSFAQAGLVQWTLAPGSALRVISVGLGHTVALERGSIRAEVTPRPASEGLVEAFAVEAAGTRVAVHGTAFSVKLEGGRAVVDVEHGTVAVGPVGHVGVTTGHMLVGPSRASFSLDGGRSARLLDPTPEPVVVAAAGPEGGSSPPPAPASGETPPAADQGAARPSEGALAAIPAPRHRTAAHAPEHPAAGAAPAAPPEPPRITADVVRARLQRCFRQQTDASREAGASTLHIDPMTITLSIDLKPDGTPFNSRFTTRVKPELVTCAGTAISGRFADDLVHVDVTVTFQP